MVTQTATRRARLLFVHAHPDDETLTTGVTMGAYAARGHEVHLLTCTLGEEGEVIPPALAHLGADRDDTLGLWRREELRAAMSVLGEVPERGVASRYRDSGMAGSPSAEHPHAFVRADLSEAAAMVAAHIRAFRPDVVVTYDKHGGYGHPDHIQTHLVTMAALSALAACPAGAEANSVAVPAAYCILTPRSWAVQDREWLIEHVAFKGEVASRGEVASTDGVALSQSVVFASSNCVVPQQDAPYPPSVVSDEIVTHVVQGPAVVDLQIRALSWHATQVRLYDGFYALSNHVAVRLCGREGFAQFDPVAGDLVPIAYGAPRHTGLLNSLQPSNDQGSR